MSSVGIDFDGVIHRYSEGWQDGSIYDDPVEGALEAIRDLQRQRIAVFVLTSRARGQLWEVADWIMRHHPEIVTQVDPDDPSEQLTFWDDPAIVLVTNRKLPAVAYIDDRAIRFNSWSQARTDLAAQEGLQL